MPHLSTPKLLLPLLDAIKMLMFTFQQLHRIPISLLLLTIRLKESLRQFRKIYCLNSLEKNNKTFFVLPCRFFSMHLCFTLYREWKIMDILIKNNRTLNGSWLLLNVDIRRPLLNLPETFINHWRFPSFGLLIAIKVEV